MGLCGFKPSGDTSILSRVVNRLIKVLHGMLCYLASCGQRLNALRAREALLLGGSLDLVTTDIISGLRSPVIMSLTGLM